MVIKIKPKFTKEYIQKALAYKLAVVKRAYFAQLQFIGEEFVKNARTNANFTDRTGNLRNSIGYIILLDGKQVVSNFVDIAKGNVPSDQDGKSIGLAKAEEVGAKFTKGYALICVAGMEYAAAVESKGFDVITSSSIIARSELIKSVESIWKKADRL